MAYPRELFLDNETEEELIQYITNEVFNHNAERDAHIRDLQQWQVDYWAKPTRERATFPFHGAATIVVPLNAIAVESIHARNMTTRFALPQLVSAHAVAPDWEDAVAPFERFFNRELLVSMDIRKPLGDCYLEATKYGTQIGKVDYERLVKTSIRQIGDREEEFDVVVHDGARLDAVPDSRFIMPHADREPDTAAWCGEEHSESPYRVMQLEMGGLFRPGTIINGPNWKTDPSQVSKLHAWVNRVIDSETTLAGNKVEQTQEMLEKTEPQWPKRIDWVEIRLPWDVDKSRRHKEIVVHMHIQSRTIMSCRYNWYSDLRRGYRTGVYFPVEHRWRGIGVCKMNEQFQKEITVQHRQRIDNGTLANMRMLVVSKLSGYGPNEPVFPGKMWFVDDMSHINTIQMGEIYPSSFNNEQATLIYQQQRLGVNELNQGMPQAGTPGTATSDLARIQEGNKKHDFVYANFTEFTQSLILDAADITQQFGPRNVTYLDTAENGALIKAVLDLPQSYIRDGLIIELKASTQQQNRVLDRQNWVQIAPMLQQYYTGLLQLAQLGAPPEISQTIVLKGMGAATEAMRQILETYDVRNIDRIVVKEIEAMLKNGLQKLGVRGNGSGQSEGPSQESGMDFITKALSSIGGNGNGGANRF